MPTCVFACPLVCAYFFITFSFVCVHMCLFALGHRVSFFGGIQYSPVNGCSAASCNFRVPAGEDERMSFYSAILEVQGQRTPLLLLSRFNRVRLCATP